MPDAPIRIGLLGASRIAPKAIIDPARSRGDVRVVAVAARDPRRAEEFAREHGVEHTSSDYAALIKRDDIDLIYIGLPPDLHRFWTIAALDAGKHVLCEKPLAMDAEDARAMVAAARRTGNHLIEAWHYRFHPLMERAIAMLPLIGQPVRVDAEACYPIPRGMDEPRWASDHGGGALMDLGCYGIHAMRTLLGRQPSVISASARMERGVDAETVAQLDFDGIPATLRCSMDPSEPRTSVHLVGELGTIDLYSFLLPQIAGRLVVTRDGAVEETTLRSPTSYAAQLDHVVALLQGRAAAITGGDDSIANMTAIDAIVRARTTQLV